MSIPKTRYQAYTCLGAKVILLDDIGELEFIKRIRALDLGLDVIRWGAVAYGEPGGLIVCRANTVSVVDHLEGCLLLSRLPSLAMERQYLRDDLNVAIESGIPFSDGRIGWYLCSYVA